MKKILLALLLLTSCFLSVGQEYSLSTNAIDYANLGTLNMDASHALARHWSLTAGVKYNPFTWKAENESGIMRNRQLVCSAGVRYWPWHVYSGWWLAAKGQYQMYNIGGISAPETQEGDRYGAGISLGYSYMILKHLNIEAGLGTWSGWDRYILYSCPRCGRILDQGGKTFILLNDVILSLTYVF